VNLRFTPFDEVNDETWASLLLRSRSTLNYEAYFIDYQLLSYPLRSHCGLVHSGASPIGLYVVYSSQYDGSVSPESLPPVYFSNNLEIRTLSDNFYSKQFGELNDLRNFLLKNSKRVSWLVEKLPDRVNLENHKETIDLVIDLRESEEELLSRMSRSHRRTIRDSLLMRQEIFTITSDSPKEYIQANFHSYRTMHSLVAGRETRPVESFNYMEDLIRKGVSKLFVSSLNSSPISYLYCDSNRQFARGWSQVTKPGLDGGIFPRTLLEWTAIKSYKREGRLTYHLGTIQGKEKNSEATPLGFEEYKRRFHPIELA